MPEATPAAPSAAPASPPPSSPSPAPAKTATPPAPAAKAPEAAPSPAPAPFKYRNKFKVDGQEMEREFSEDELRVFLQKGLASDKRFSELSEKEKRLASALDLLKNDPDAAAKALGLDLEAHYTKKLAERYKTELMTPEQKAQQEIEAKIRAAEEKAANADKALKDRLRAESDAKLLAKTQTEFMAELETRGLADGSKPAEAAEFLYEMALVKKRNKDLTAKEVALEVDAKIDRSFEKLSNKVMGGLKGEALLKRLGPSVVKEVLAARMAQVRAAQPLVADPAPAPVPQRSVAEETVRKAIEPGRNSRFLKSLL